VLALTLHKRNQAMWTPQSLDARRAAAEELVAMVEAERFPADLEAVALFGGASVDWETGDTARAGARVERARALAERTGAPALITQIDFFRAALMITRGEPTRADALVDETYELYRRTRRWAADTFRAAFKTVAWTELGRLDGVVAISPGILDSPYASTFGEAIALAYVELGDLDRAAALATDLPPLFDSWMLLGVLAAAAHVRVALGDRSGAEVLHRQLLPYSGRMAVPGTGPALGDVDLALARVERLLGDRDAAVAHLASSIELLTRADAAPWAVRALLERHDLLGDPEDLERASQLVARRDLPVLRDRVARRQATSK
jgi:hypothetical protein